ncbi:unnamed protein product [Rhizopus stolonifer]
MLTFVVTGASRGLGLQYFKQISARGDTVFACAHNPEQTQDLKHIVDNQKMFAIQLDVTCEINQDELFQTFGTNVVAANEVTKGFLPLLRKRGDVRVKKIVNISSFLGSIRSATTYLAGCNTFGSYRIFKAALNMLTKLQSFHLAKENFIVCSIHPGWCKTEMGGENAHLTTEESVIPQLDKINSITASENGGFFNWKGDIEEY